MTYPVEKRIYQQGSAFVHTHVYCLYYNAILDVGCFVDLYSGYCFSATHARTYGPYLSLGRILDGRMLLDHPEQGITNSILRGDVEVIPEIFGKARFYIFWSYEYMFRLTDGHK